MPRFEIEHTDDEHWSLIDRESDNIMVNANHDEHGWAGLDLLEEIATSLNKIV